MAGKNWRTDLTRFDRNIERAKVNAEKWSARYEELVKKKQEAENTQIVDMVHSLNITPEQLKEFIGTGRMPAPVRAEQPEKKEETKDE